MAAGDYGLVIFDVDGTLIDSAGLICAAMAEAFAAAGRAGPGDAATRAIVGLSLPVAVARLGAGLDGGLDGAGVAAVTAHYKTAFTRLRAEGGEVEAAPLFPGARAALARLGARGAPMAVATGKARRGLEHILDGHDLRGFFAATQTADDAPSKPHPGMVFNALRATGAGAARSVMVGDTTFDIEMARAAGVTAVGVAWGCHPAADLRAAGAAAVIEDFAALDATLAELGLAQ